MSFKIVNTNLKVDYTVNDELVIFETGKEAALEAQRLTSHSWAAHKFVVKPYIKPSDDWKQREQGRFDSGKYIRVPPELEKHCLPEHFVHVATKNPEKIAFTPSPEKGAEDKQKLSSVIGYLERYAPDIDGDLREELDELYSDRFATYELKFAKTADEIEKVYTFYDESQYGVAQSCMRYENDDYFISQVHPVRVYGDSDLQVAFITNEEGETMARAMVRPELRIYSRVYGGDETMNKLHRLLKKHGYKKSSGYYDDYEEKDVSDEGINFSGALIQAIPYDGKNKVNAHVMPYIDEFCDVGLVTVNGKEWMKIGEYGFHCQGTSGLTHDQEELEGTLCEHCGKEVNDENDLISVKIDRWNYSNWCPHCAETESFYCNGTFTNYTHENFCERTVNDLAYVEAYAEANFIYCGGCDEYHTEPLVKVKVDNGSTDEMCQDCFDGEYGDQEAILKNGIYRITTEDEDDETEIVMKETPTTIEQKTAALNQIADAAATSTFNWEIVGNHRSSAPPTINDVGRLMNGFNIDDMINNMIVTGRR